MIAEAGLLVRRTQFVRSKLTRETQSPKMLRAPSVLTRPASPLPLLPGPTSPKHTRHRRLRPQVPPTTQTALRPRSISHTLDQGPVVRCPPRGTLRHPRPPRPAARGHADCPRWPSDPALRRQWTAQILPGPARAAPALLLKAPPIPLLTSPPPRPATQTSIAERVAPARAR